ncbi:nuclear transport factor 2 family protein [Sphingomonas donggukensis]|uniref:Nuclear transport factor 2 family protein n=1 Tax=Sphingomonas donggukensis TaxID=2949093 RepID=A0ABY4TTW7_9SPHN|nr:nuclear transport factor 2 family protein [Sphingomonas donggukensis]URW75848.1 nuclear transport factor 2 family protein [Sphingomonas donggukensis]
MRNSMMTFAAIAVVLPASSTAQPAGRAADTRAVVTVLAQYKAAIERLDPNGTERLFTQDSQIFETGGAEGTYTNYLAHHLGPELKAFRSFVFSDYKIDVRFVGAVALATETYRYRIVPNTGEAADRLGVATSVLRKVGGDWRIVSMHNSARRPPSQ